MTKILYIESHSALRETLAQLLQVKREYEIEVACHGVEGLAKARLWQPDLILMGLRLPIMDGFQIIRRLRSQPETANIPIIVVSAWDNASSKQQALEAGANEHLASPVELSRLIRRIEHYLDQK